MTLSKQSLLNCFAAIALLAVSAHTAQAAGIPWTTVHSQASTTTNQMRGVAVSGQPGNDSVYVTYIQTTGVTPNRRIEQRSTISPYSVLSSFNSVDQPKGVATDDRGNVFVAYRNSGDTSSYLRAFSSTLTAGTSTAGSSPVIGGIAIQQVGPTYYAYAVYEAGGLVQRYDVTNPGAMTLDLAFNGTGSFNIPGAANLRGIDVAADGTIYVAARSDNRVYKVSSDLSTVTSNTFTRPMDVALYGDKLYATSYNGTNSFLRLLDPATMTTIEDITASTLNGGPYSRGANEGWSGVDVDAQGNIYMADQHFGSAGGTQDRLLLAVVPEPASFALAGLAVVGLFVARRRLGG